MVKVRVLGALEARVAGAPVPLPADARARELLAWLAVHPGPHPGSALAGRMRPDVAEESARNRLGEVLVARGDRDHARDTLTETIGRAEALATAGLAEHAAAALETIDH